MIPQDQRGRGERGEGAELKTRISSFIYPPSINRCQHIKVNGVQCGSPALKNRNLCHFHQRWQQGRIQLNANRARRSRYSLDLPILEDANSIQVALMQGVRLLLTSQIDHKTAALLFYALQNASTNLCRLKLSPLPEQVVIDPKGVPDTSLGDNAWYKEEFEEEEQEEGSDSHWDEGSVNIQACVGTGLRPVQTGQRPVSTWASSQAMKTPAAHFRRDYETLKTCLGGEQIDSNHRLIYTCACASPQKCRAVGLFAAVKSHRSTVRF